MRCAACGEETASAPCGACGADPRVGGRYRLDEVVGRGASGTVYRGVDVQTDAAVAIKEMAFRMGTDAKTRDLVVREGRVLRQLRHPGIPRWIDEVVEGTGRARALFLVQEFIDGTSLAEALADHRWSEDEALGLMAEVLPILEYLHTRHPPVIHRDLKPGNLLRRSDGGLVLVDFGAVRDVLATSQGGGSTVAGTFGYMAPEQFRGHAEPATDLYALGVSIVGLLSRQDPAGLHDRAGRLLWEPAVAVSAGTHALLGALLSPAPDDRPASAAVVLRQVEALQAAARVAPTPKRAGRLVHGAGGSSLGDADLGSAAPPLLRPRSRIPAPDLEQPIFEPPATPGTAAPGSIPRAAPVRRQDKLLAWALGGALLILLLVLSGGLLLTGAPTPTPTPTPTPRTTPTSPAPRVMPVPEIRPVPELQGGHLLPATSSQGSSRCIRLGGELGAHRDALPEAVGPGLIVDQPAIDFPEGEFESGDTFSCSLRFAVDPEGLAAEVGIGVEGCPGPFQATLCDTATAWRFAAPEGVAADGGFIAPARVIFRKP